MFKEEDNPQNNPMMIRERLEEDFGEIDPQLFVALTSRWRKEDGTLAFGISRNKLQEKMALTTIELENLLEAFGRK